MLYLIKDSLMPREDPIPEGISKTELHEKIILEGAQREDFMD